MKFNLNRTALSIVATFLLLTAGASFALAQGANLVTSNSDFPSGSGMAGWNVTAPPLTSATNQTTTLSAPLVGNVCVMSTPSTGGIVSIDRTISITADRYYRLALGYTTSRPSGMTLEAEIDDGGTPITYSIPLTPTFVGTELIYDFYVPSGYGTTPLLIFRLTNPGGLGRSVQLDNISLTELK